MVNIYRLALQVQDASNIQGVIRSLQVEVLPAIREEAGYAEQGTSYVAEHPVVLLFLDKLVSLTRKGYIHDMDMAISDAYTLCHELAEGLAAVEAKREAALPYAHLGDTACQGCGRVEPMGVHYSDCTLLEPGDTTVEREADEDLLAAHDHLAHDTDGCPECVAIADAAIDEDLLAADERKLAGR